MNTIQPVDTSFSPKKIILKKTDSDVTTKLNVDNIVSQPEIKEAAFVDDVVTPVIDSAKDVVTQTITQAIDTVAGPAAPLVNSVVSTVTNGFRLTSLPVPDQDFAMDWFYSTQKETVQADIINEYNTYLQAFDELEQGQIVLPAGYDGKTIANDLKMYVLQDFRKYDVKLSTTDNLAHQTYYSHCVQRAIDNLKQGEYTGLDGYTKKRPEVADAILNRINEILFDKMMGK